MLAIPVAKRLLTCGDPGSLGPGHQGIYLP
jgi:hypothetical protein